MFRDEKLELKVGMFIGLAMFLLFIIVFSISDFYIFEKGYNVSVIFDFVNGIGEDAPVRLAGVLAGEVKDIEIYFDTTVSKTRVRLKVWVKSDIKIEEDAVARINTLGLLGEQYLEITPGTSDRFLKDGDVVTGKNPVSVGEQVENVSGAIKAIKGIADKLNSGEGTLGKLLTEDTFHEDLVVISGRLSRGEGTIGKLLAEEKIYNDLEAFVSDIKAHPWKLLAKPSRRKQKEKDVKRGVMVGPK